MCAQQVPSCRNKLLNWEFEFEKVAVTVLPNLSCESLMGSTAEAHLLHSVPASVALCCCVMENKYLHLFGWWDGSYQAARLHLAWGEDSTTWGYTSVSHQCDSWWLGDVWVKDRDISSPLPAFLTPSATLIFTFQLGPDQSGVNGWKLCDQTSSAAPWELDCSSWIRQH